MRNSDQGASLRDRATRPPAQAPSGLGDNASVPSAATVVTLGMLQDIVQEARANLTGGYTDDDSWVAVQAIDYIAGAIARRLSA